MATCGWPASSARTRGRAGATSPVRLCCTGTATAGGASPARSRGATSTASPPPGSTPADGSGWAAPSRPTGRMGTSSRLARCWPCRWADDGSCIACRAPTAMPTPQSPSPAPLRQTFGPWVAETGRAADSSPTGTAPPGRWHRFQAPPAHHALRHHHTHRVGRLARRSYLPASGPSSSRRPALERPRVGRNRRRRMRTTVCLSEKRKKLGCLRIAMLSLALMGTAVGCSRGAAQSTGSTGNQSHPTSPGSTGDSPVSRSLHYPRAVTWYGGPLLSLPDTGTFDWLCTGPTGSTRRFHIRYTATTNEQLAVVEMHGPQLRYSRPTGLGRHAPSPASRAANLAHPIRRRKRHDHVGVRFQFAVIGGACVVQRTTASRTFASNTL